MEPSEIYSEGIAIGAYTSFPPFHSLDDGPVATDHS